MNAVKEDKVGTRTADSPPPPPSQLTDSTAHFDDFIN